MFSISNCPVCSSDSFSPVLICKDYTVSKEDFTIVQCEACSFQFTNPRPSDEFLGRYYKSEDYISHSNTKKGIISRLYHAVRSRTLEQKVKLISKYVSRGTLLDYGCGTGMFLKTCQKAGWKAVGMEPDQGAAAIATELGLTVFADKAKIEEYSSSQKFDAITLWHVLEHVTDLEDTLSFFKARLNANGVLVIAVPNHTSYDAQYYERFWAAYDVPRHLYHFSKDTVEKLLNRFDFKLVQTHAMKFDSFYVSMLSEKYKTGSIKYVSAFINGLRSNLKAKDTEEYSSVIYVFKAK